MMDDYKNSDNFQGGAGCKMISPHHSHPTNGVRPSDSWCFLAKAAFSVAGIFACSLLVCVCGTLIFSRFATALVIFPLLSLDLYLLILCLRRLRCLARVRSRLSKLIATVIVVCILALDGMFLLVAGPIALKVFAIGDEYFADNLSVPADVPIGEYFEDLRPVDIELPPVAN